MEEGLTTNVSRPTGIDSFSSARSGSLTFALTSIVFVSSLLTSNAVFRPPDEIRLLIEGGDGAEVFSGCKKTSSKAPSVCLSETSHNNNHENSRFAVWL